MAVFDPGELKGKASRLETLLEKDKEEITGALEGDIAQAYRDLLDLEIIKAREIRRWVDNLFW